MTGIIIHRSRHAQQYVVIPNSIARDFRLSFRARGLLMHLLSLPPDWHVTTEILAQDNPDSRTSIRAAMNELRLLGYAVLHTERGQRGRLLSRLEVFDTDFTGRGVPAFGATSGNIDVPGRTEDGQPAPGATSGNAHSPRSHRRRGARALIEVQEEVQEPLSLSAEFGEQLDDADADIDERERFARHLVNTLCRDPRRARPFLRMFTRTDLLDHLARFRSEDRGNGASGGKPDWCRKCNPETRMVEEDPDHPYRCPNCHPLSVP